MNAVKAVNATLVCIALAVATLAGCTGMHADVHTATPAAALAGERTYTFARLPMQEARADHAQFETVLRDELAKQGFADTTERPAHYVLSVGYETRPAQIRRPTHRSRCSAHASTVIRSRCGFSNA
jgi:hypothetical protein